MRRLETGLAVAAAIAAAVSIVGLSWSQGGPEKPPELKVLERRVGVWDSETKAEPDPWGPGFEAKEVETSEWVLGGRFLQTRTGKNLNESSRIFLRTYDTQKKAYRGWLFDKQGNASEWIGNWDEAKQEMTWTSESGGYKTAARQRYVDKDNIVWTMTVKDRDGDAVHDFTGKLKRKAQGRAE